MKMRRRKYNLKRQASFLKQDTSSVNQQSSAVSMEIQKIHQHLNKASQFKKQKLQQEQQLQALQNNPQPSLFSPFQQLQGQFPSQSQQTHNHSNQSQTEDKISIILKISALMKVIYKSQPYRIFNITINIIYMFGVLIQLPSEVCSSDNSQFALRCKLSRDIQLVCILLICPLFLIKVLRLVGIDSFKCIIELLTFICGIMIFTGPQVIIKYIKALRCLRILLIVRQTILIVPAYNMLTSLKSISNVLCPAILFIYIYAIIGLYSFSGNEYSRCRDPSVLSLTNDWSVYEDAKYLCGQRQCPYVNGLQYQCLNPLDYSVQPTVSEFQHIQFGNGLLKYSNIFSAVLTTYKQTFITGSSRIILLEKQSMNFIFVLAYYYSFIYLLSYIYLNIFYGLMIVNRDNHITTKEEYEAITDKNDKYVMCEKQMKLIARYEKIFKRFKRNINLFSTVALDDSKKRQLIYRTQKDLSDNSIAYSKRSGFNLDKGALMSAAIQHQVTRKIIDIVELNFPNSENVESSKNSCPSKIFNCIKKVYYYFNILVVILSCVNICLQHEGQDYNFAKITNFLDLIFFGQFMLDFIGRYFCLVYGVDQKDGQMVVVIPKRMYIEGLILSVCTTGYLYEVLVSDGFQEFYMANTKIQKIFRAMLYLRIIVILGFQPYFQDSRKLFQFALEAVKKSANFIILWFLVIIMFSLMGYFLFGQCNSQQNCYADTQYQASFQGIFQSIITTAVIMYNEDWDYIGFQQYPRYGYFIVIWNLVIITIGLLIISKYFMTYLLSQLDTRMNQNFDKENQEKVQQKSFIQNLLKQNEKDENETLSEKSQNQQNQQTSMINANIDANKNLKNDISQDVQVNQIQKINTSKKVNFGLASVVPQEKVYSQKPDGLKRKRVQFKRRCQRSNPSHQLKIQEKKNFLTEKPAKNLRISQKQKDIKENCEQLDLNCPISPKSDTPTFQNSQNLLYSFLKSRLYMIIKSIAIVIVVFGCFHYSPHKSPDDKMKKFVLYSSIVVDCFFIIDMVVTIWVQGAIKFIKKSNLSTWIEIFLNIVSIVYFTPLGNHYIVKRLYVCRCMRISYWLSLRCQKSQSMKVTAKGFSQLIPKIFGLLFVICIIYGFFANIIVRMYKDEMWECTNFNPQANITTKIDCLNNGGDWIQQELNASNFGNALLYIFLISSTEDWLNVMNYLSTIKGSDLQPVYTNSSIIRILFLIFIFFANFIVMNIFVSVCINNFKQIKKKVTGQSDLSKDEKQWLNIKNQIYLLQPQPMDQQPTNEFRKIIFKVMKSKQMTGFKFLQFVGVLVLLSFVTTDMSRNDMNKIIIGEYIFVSCGFFTFLMELLAFGIKSHNKGIRWLQSILYIYAAAYGISLLVLDLPNSQRKLFGGILITLQLGRYFLFILQFEFFQKMFNSLLTILPKTKDIFFLMLATLFIYTVIGIQIFGYLKPGKQLNEFDENYVDFIGALFSLVKFSTWQEPIQQIRDGIKSLNSNSVCFEIHDYQSFMKYGQNGCGNPALALIFFLSFNIIYSLILLPTLMGIIFDSYNEVYIDQFACINKFQLMKVKQQWKKFDPQGTGYISYRQFWVLTSKIIKIYKFTHNKLLNNETRQHFMKQLNISIYESPEGILCFQFHEVIEALTRIILIRKEKNPKRRQIYNKKKTYIHEVNKKSQILHKLKKSSYDSSHVLTLILLKSGLKSWRNKTDDRMKATLFKTIQMKKSNGQSQKLQE